MLKSEAAGDESYDVEDDSEANALILQKVFNLLVIVIAQLATDPTYCRFVTLFQMPYIQIWLDTNVKKAVFA